MSRTGISRGAGMVSHSPRLLSISRTLADVAGALGVGVEAAGDIGMAQGFLDAQDNGLDGEQPFLGAHGVAERVAAMLGGDGHQAEQGGPIHGAAAREVAGVRIQQAQFVGGDEHKAGFVQSTSAGAPEHLQEFIGLEAVVPASSRR